MTAAQRAHFFRDLWPPAAKARGVDPADREARLDFFQAVLGERRSLTSFSNADFDAVKARCLLLVDNLAGAMEDGHPDVGERRRLVHAIEQFLAAYWRAIARARFKTTDLDALSVSQLTQLRNTLNARKNKLRNKATQPDRVEPAAVAAEEDNVPF